MKYRLIVFKGIYDTLDVFVDHLVKGFEQLGYEVFIFDVRNMDENIMGMTQFVNERLIAVITFNNLGINLELKDIGNFWNKLGIHVIDILVDHPAHYHDMLISAPEKTVVLCIDENHAEYIKRFYPNILVADFMAHGGTQVETELIPWNERSIDVLYAGSLSSKQMTPQIFNIGRYNNLQVNRIWNGTLERIINDSGLTTERAIEEELLSEGIKLNDNELRELISDFVGLDYCVVSYYREKVLKTLVEAGINITIYGGGWEKCEWITAPNCHLMSRIPAKDILLKMYDSKIVLNIMTWFKRGSHERIINGMLAGAVVVSDESTYLSDSFENGKELYTFSLNDIDKLPIKIKSILSDSSSATVASNGRNRALQSERWENRAYEIDYYLLESLKDET